MSSNPYENEPGYENAKSDRDKQHMQGYVLKVNTFVDRIFQTPNSLTLLPIFQIRHETLRIAVIQPLEISLGIQPDGTTAKPSVDSTSDDDEDQLLPEDESQLDPFVDLRKLRFLWYFESYINSTDKEESNVPRNREFDKMPFEHGGNIMAGHFNFPELKRRLVTIKDSILSETQNWAAEGRDASEKERGIAVNLQRQHEQIVEDLKAKKNFAVDLSLRDSNPFVWQLMYYGRPMTQLEGGIFKIKICLSTRFPDEQPRVFVETPLFHHRVSKEGVLCYFPERTEEMKYHVDAIVSALEEESPRYDPRATVNPEASNMFWFSPDGRKMYNRALRRTVQRSAE